MDGEIVRDIDYSSGLDEEDLGLIGILRDSDFNITIGRDDD